MLIWRTDPFSGDNRYLEIDITPTLLERVNNRKDTGELIQDIVPHLSADEREFLMTGIYGSEFDSIVGKED